METVRHPCTCYLCNCSADKGILMYFLHHAVEHGCSLVNLLVDDCVVTLCQQYNAWTPYKIREHYRGLPSSSVRFLRAAEALKHKGLATPSSRRSRLFAAARLPQTAPKGLPRLSEGGSAILATDFTGRHTGAPQPYTRAPCMLIAAKFTDRCGNGPAHKTCAR